MPEVSLDPIATTSIAASTARGAPTVGVTAPSGPVGSTSVTVTWTYSSPVSRAQAWYRVRLYDPTGTALLFDAGTVAGTATSAALGFILSSGSSYLVRVDASDGIDSGFGTSSFSVATSGVGDFPTNDQVGSRFEIAINGVGYMLADNPERPLERSVGVLQAPRLATSDTPFTESLERYTFVGQTDFSGGAGQRYADRESSSPTRFYSSENVNPFEDGISLLPETSLQISDTYASPHAVVAGSTLYMASDTNEIKAISTFGGAVTTFTIAGAGTVVDMASDGVYWYWTDGTDIYRNNTAADPGTTWDTHPASTGYTQIEWCSDRLAASYTNGAGQSVLTTFADAGTEEEIGGRFKFDDGTIDAITAGSGQLMFAVNRSNRSDIYTWTLGSTDSRTVALSMPAGLTVSSLGFYLGNVLVRAVDGAGAAHIYRAVADATLIPELVLTINNDSLDHSVGEFAGDDRFVLFSWRKMNDNDYSGVGAIDLATGGWCRWLVASADQQGDVFSVFHWNGKLGFTVSGGGAFVEATDPVATGYLTTSASDLGSSLVKVLDELSVISAPLPATSEVALEISIDGATSYTSVGSYTSAGIKGGTWPVAQEAASVSTKIVLSTTGTVSPSVSAVQVQLHPLSIVDAVTQLPINCARRKNSLNGTPLPELSSWAQIRSLESLVGTRVLLQNVDWPDTRAAEVWEVVSAETRTHGAKSAASSQREENSPVCVLGLRRPT